jgi:hypothetical protein
MRWHVAARGLPLTRGLPLVRGVAEVSAVSKLATLRTVEEAVWIFRGDTLTVSSSFQLPRPGRYLTVPRRPCLSRGR